MKFYRVRWSKFLLTLSLFIILVCVVLAFWPLLRGGTASFVSFTKFPAGPVRLLMLVYLVWTALLVVRGYTVTPDAILVRRLGWRSLRIPRSEVQSVQTQQRTVVVRTARRTHMLSPDDLDGFAQSLTSTR